MVAMVLGGHSAALLKDPESDDDTGGRGLWTNAIQAFCNDIKAEPDLGISSLDWGFNEQIGFLSDHRQLSEPIWRGQQLVRTSRCCYLTHPFDYTTARAGWEFYLAVRDAFRLTMSLHTYRDREGKVAFYALRVYGFETGPRRKLEIDAAITRLRRAVAMTRTLHMTISIWALLEGRGLLAEAIAHYQKARRINPGDAEVRYNLGMALYGAKGFEEGVFQLREAIRLLPSNAIFVNRLAWFLATCPDSSLRNGALSQFVLPNARDKSLGRSAGLLGHVGRRLCRGRRLSPGCGNCDAQ